MTDTKLRNERTVVSTMVRVYCRGQGHNHPMCAECAELLAYAEERIAACPFAADKPFCSRCRVHCYEPVMRDKIRQVMRYSGPRMLIYHPVAALRHFMVRRKRIRGN